MRRPRRIIFGLGLLLAAVLLQTTLFARLRPVTFGVVPDLVLIMVIAVGRWLDTEVGLLFGFTGGLFVDLLGGTPLGLRALVLTLVAYGALRLSERNKDDPLALAGAVAALTVLSVVLFSLIATLFGVGAQGGIDVVKRLLLMPIYNVMLAAAIVPLATSLMAPRRREVLL